ncbi:MAG: GH13 [uncultured Chloroflexia bacterium]|uniref:GH13 n=1 Tax=uncultured Chloroflexia bacterium TaxID=1672391 RepID=A0A6J4JTE1_9CHLR|nr:MAG: GH13 [uncultured Chloroflexia bacterium]
MQRHTAARQLEFHVSRQARDRYQFDQALFQLTGNVVFANFHAARVFAQKMNDKRDLVNYPEQAVRAGQLNAMGLIDEILHLMVASYRESVDPNAMRKALHAVEQELGASAVDAALLRFADEFPALAVYRAGMPPEEWLAGETNGVPHRELALEEMLMLWLGNVNPAFAPFMELFDDANLERQTAYPQIFPRLHTFFGGQPGYGADGQNLIDVLRAPALASPHSLTGQLQFIRERWGTVLSKSLFRVLGSLDLIQEEEKAVFAGGGPGPSEVYEFAGLAVDPERFSRDLDWMPRLVLIAKNAYVWLDQLSRRYGRPIDRLDQIPDEELETLARWGFNGLWLIGLWERSVASQRIKQLTGNPDAVASAYSLLDYRIAADLGGEEACNNLRERALQRGIRLASDMVPNHMGIDSTWVIEHPDWFISLDHSPFPSYSFTGPDLSADGRAGIFLEDHYYNRSDAAVVFKRVDRGSGREQYIYHGNDGTSMPWNDTAQLNYLQADVREAVIQTILHVARQFPVIRFDAAMTLAKRHIQRLWFPEPGSGGAIASRAEHAMTRQQFDALIPNEFWREVVDRVAQEAPDTLLLAEAFWMMEGYFVRTLGMHRVYNSAFMNMIRDEENAKYRSVIKNTLEFDPEILKRYVNFMNNPDERTAVEQFGKGDKYFGVCTLMVTMPGLPMVGHGQIEGFTEKYGMEYRRAYWDERPDMLLVQRHEHEIFPLLHHRYLFAGVENFLFYDFVGAEGHADENVFAYSNRVGNERALVVVHNAYATARGRIRTSVSYSIKTGGGDERSLVRKELGEGLNLAAGSDRYIIFRDQVTELEYIRRNNEIFDTGLYLELGAYKTHVFLDFREAHDSETRQYGALVDYLAGQGVPSIEEALRETFLQPVHAPFRELVNAGLFRRLDGARVTTVDDEATPDAIQAAGDEPRPAITTPADVEGVSDPAAMAGTDSGVPVQRDDDPNLVLLDEVEQKTMRLLREIKAFTQAEGDETVVAREIRRKLEAMLRLDALLAQTPAAGANDGDGHAEFLNASLADDNLLWSSQFVWLFTHALGKLVSEQDFEAQSRSWIDEWLLGKLIADALQNMGLDSTAAARGVTLAKALTSQQQCFVEHARGEQPAYSMLESWLKDDDVRQFLQVNRHQGILWFNKESFEQLLHSLFVVAAIDAFARPGRTPDEAAVEIGASYDIARRLQQAEAEAEYRVENLLAAARGETPEVVA